MSEQEGLASRRKRLLYIGLFSFQILVVFWPLLTIDLIEQKRIGLSLTAMGMIETFWVLALTITSIFFVKEFITKKWVLLTVISFFVISTVLNIMGRSVPSITNDYVLFNRVNGFGLFLVFINLLLIFNVAVQDIFRIKHDTFYSLMGSANIFLLIGSLFAFVIAILGSISPGLVVPLEQSLLLDIRANEYAFYTLASVDLPYNDVNPFIRKILVLESIFAHLFVVIIIGRLLSK